MTLIVAPDGRALIGGPDSREQMAQANATLRALAGKVRELEQHKSLLEQLLAVLLLEIEGEHPHELVVDPEELETLMRYQISAWITEAQKGPRLHARLTELPPELDPDAPAGTSVDLPGGARITKRE
jgi:hypothetical protein